MNKKLGLAVAGALVAFSSAANAGITIPAGDWTVDIGGNVNAFYINTNAKDSNKISGGLATKESNSSNQSSINTGLLPSWLTIGAHTRQNDLDVAWAISFQPGASSAHGLQGGGSSEFRQAYFTFGDASWGTVKIGKDLGVFGSDAILADMTLLGVGSGSATGGTTTTLGRIGTGYMYADFTGQINYTTPNWNGLQATVGIAQPWTAQSSAGYKYGDSPTDVSASSSGSTSSPRFEGKVAYSFSANDVNGKVWAEFASQEVKGLTSNGSALDNTDYVEHSSATAHVYGVGANVAYQGATLTGYYYDGKGAGTTGFLLNGFDKYGDKRSSNGGYVQATYVIPTIGTKIGASWGESNLDRTAGDEDFTSGQYLVKKNEMWTVGVYHPLTKSINLVAEYSRVESTNQIDEKNKSDAVSLGGILFF